MTRWSRAITTSLALLFTACATTRFDRALSQQKWSDAAAAFTADTALLSNEHALYQAGLLFGTPGRTTYNPTRAHDLLSALLTRFPTTKFRVDATERLAFIDDVIQTRRAATAQQGVLESRITALTAESHALALRLDSVVGQRDSLRASITRLEQDRRERDDQLRALRLELQRLKEIDLKPRTPPPPLKPIKP